MKYALIAIISVLMISGCSLSPSKSFQSEESAFISTVTANGCDLHEIDMTKSMGKMKIKCK